MNNGKRVLILGGEGFIGRNIAEVLSDESECFSVGNIKSFFLERNDSFLKINPYKEAVNSDFDVYIHLIDNQVELDNFLKEERNLMKNLSISRNSHLIVFSSAVVYANPDSPYGKRKLELEKFYEEFCQRKNINLTTVRLFNIYGKYHLPYRQGGLVANIFFNYLNGLPVEINDLETKRDFIYATDMAIIIKDIINSKKFGKYDLATGKLISIGEIIEILKNNVIKKLKIINKNNGEKILSPAGNNELSKILNLVKIEDGLKKAYLFYEKNNQLIKDNLKL
ncbi:MAG: NAD-dependent epimerase/dehydratase family protein [Candidatus Moraniibacteriota bacterium]